MWSKFVNDCIELGTLEENCKSTDYLYLRWKSEIGEICGKVAKNIRGDYTNEEFKKQLRYEIGDNMWFAAIVHHLYSKTSTFFSFARYDYGNKFVNHSDYVEEFSDYIDELNDSVDNYFFGSLEDFDPDECMEIFGRIAGMFGITLEECASAVLEKLAKRKENGCIRGDGDGTER